MKLISLEAAKEHLRLDQDSDDTDVERKIEQASHLVLDYLGQGDDVYADSDGVIPEDAEGEPDVPFSVRAATTLLTAMLYKGEVDMGQLDHGYLPRPVMNLLYPRRTPPLG